MPWARLNDKANSDAKLLALSDAAWRMWGCGLIYCQNGLTDGFIPEHAIHAFGVRAANKAKVADELCQVLVAGKSPLWHRVAGGYRVHDHLTWNDTREDVLEERERGRQRQEKFRKKKRSDNGTGNLLGNGAGNALQDGVKDVVETGDPQPQPQISTAEERGGAADRRSVKSHPVRDLLGHYQERYLEHVGQKPHIAGGKDAGLVAGLLKQHDEATVRRALDLFFQTHDDFVTRSGYSLGLFVSQFNRWLAASSGPRPAVKAENACPHVTPCAHAQECYRKMRTPAEHPVKAAAS